MAHGPCAHASRAILSRVRGVPNSRVQASKRKALGLGFRALRALRVWGLGFSLHK